MPRVMGGVFGYPDSRIGNAASPHFLQSPHVLLANARAGMRLLIETIKPARVWLPSYLCDAMVAAVQSGQQAFSFYPIDAALRVSELDWIADVQKGDLVVVVSYFGFPGDTAVKHAVHAQGAFVLHDAAQALFSEPESEDDFILYSPRKFIGVPDGGILCFMIGPEMARITLDPSPSDWWLRTVQASVQRSRFDRCGGSREWFAVFKQVERDAPIEPYAMSWLSHQLLLHAFDYPSISGARRANYVALLRSLSEFALYPVLPEGIVPLGFPMSLRNRDTVRSELFAADIYPPVHWPLDETVPSSFADSHRLAETIMTLPCDQRYGIDDMKRMSAIVLKAMSR